MMNLSFFCLIPFDIRTNRNIRPVTWVVGNNSLINVSVFLRTTWTLLSYRVCSKTAVSRHDQLSPFRSSSLAGFLWPLVTNLAAACERRASCCDLSSSTGGTITGWTGRTIESGMINQFPHVFVRRRQNWAKYGTQGYAKGLVCRGRTCEWMRSIGWISTWHLCRQMDPRCVATILLHPKMDRVGMVFRWGAP